MAESFENSDKIYLLGKLNIIYKIYYNVYHNNDYVYGAIEEKMFDDFIDKLNTNYSISISKISDNFETVISAFLDRIDLTQDEKFGFIVCIETLHNYVKNINPNINSNGLL